jgi:hypothetical protein
MAREHISHDHPPLHNYIDRSSFSPSSRMSLKECTQGLCGRYLGNYLADVYHLVLSLVVRSLHSWHFGMERIEQVVHVERAC